jgi:hypothetical protein
VREMGIYASADLPYGYIGGVEDCGDGFEVWTEVAGVRYVDC